MGPRSFRVSVPISSRPGRARQGMPRRSPGTFPLPRSPRNRVQHPPHSAPGGPADANKASGRCIQSGGRQRMHDEHGRVPACTMPISPSDTITRTPPAPGGTSGVGDPLLHRVGRGDDDAVRECIERFSGLVWSLARRIGLPERECEDAVQEVFAELWRFGSRYDPSIASETAFVATIARRRLIDRRRKVTRHAVPQALLNESPLPDASRLPETLRDEARQAQQAISQLTSEQQRVLRLSVYEGLSHDLIARSTGMPLGTVKTHARRGLMKLRELLGAGQATSAEGGSAS